MGYLLALLIGVVAGMRSMTAPAAASWAARLVSGSLSGTGLAFMGHPWTPWIFSALAVVELIADQLPTIPSRKTPGPFATRLVSGALAGAVVASRAGHPWVGALAGVVGAVAGTLGGAAARSWLAAKFGKDRPAAIVEDLAALAIAGLVVVGFLS